MTVPFYKSLGTITKALALTAVGLVLFKAFGWFGLSAIAWWAVLIVPFVAWAFVFLSLLVVVVVLALPYAIAKTIHETRKTK